MPSIKRFFRKGEGKRLLIVSLGIALFAVVYFLPSSFGIFSPATDPNGKVIELSREGRGALALFPLAVIWWVFEVIPIGATALLLGTIQALLFLRPPTEVFGDFFHPAVLFIFASLTIGKVSTKTGLAQRIAYKMLTIAGESTRMIYLVCFAIVFVLTAFMAHTAVAATVFPLFMAINSLYSDDDKETRFSKGLFIGMAQAAAAGSVLTLLGSSRAIVALGFFEEIYPDRPNIGFLELSYYMIPIGTAMGFLIWITMMIEFKPEKKNIPGIKERIGRLYERLGPLSNSEITAIGIFCVTLAAFGSQFFFPSMRALDKSAIILASTILFFLFKLLDTKDLQDAPWNVIIFFGGAMSLGFCFSRTGGSEWLAVKILPFFIGKHWFVFIFLASSIVLLLTNAIINVAVLALMLPVALTISKYLGIAPEVVLYSFLVSVGMPFLLLFGSAPNAIAFGSRQFTSREFFKAGVPACILLLILLSVFALVIWPAMGLKIFY